MKRLALAAALLAPAKLAGLIFAPPAAAQLTASQPVYVVFFPEWSGDLDAAATAVIADAAAAAKAAAGATVTVTGFADGTTAGSSGPADLLLSRLRAQRVVDRLSVDGVPAASLTLQAAGAQSAAGIRSRRVEITISQ